MLTERSYSVLAGALHLLLLYHLYVGEESQQNAKKCFSAILTPVMLLMNGSMNNFFNQHHTAIHRIKAFSLKL